MIDLHTHSTASDGTLTPRALVDFSAASGLEALALTDHDTVAGIAEAAELAEQVKLRFIPGIELSTSCDGVREVHILGYYVEPGHVGVREACAWLRACRWLRAEQIVEQLNRIGVAVELDRVAAQAKKGSVGRPHIARAVVEAGYADTLGEAFRRWLVPGAPAYVEKQQLTTQEAIQVIRSAGGVAVLAHPGTLPLSQEHREKLIAALTCYGLRGLEAYWSRHTEKEVALYEELATQYRLVATGGSDFHGANKPGLELGVAAGNRRLPLALVTEIERWRGEVQ